LPDIGVVKNIKPQNLNIFLVPTKGTASKDTYCQNAETLVDDYYDYSVAKTLLQDIDLEGDGIYLVACKGAISTGDCDRKKMLVVNLTTVNERLSEFSILEFRSQTRKKVYWNDTSLRHLVIALRLMLPEVADFIGLAEASVRER
jgi:hypothetical protein